MSKLRLVLLLACIQVKLPAQQPVALRNMHERIIAVVPLVGAGTYADPKRPLFAPTPEDIAKAAGIIGYTWVASDDGRSAIVELVAKNRAAFAAILADRGRVLRLYEKGKSDPATIERELRQFKRDYRFNPREVQR